MDTFEKLMWVVWTAGWVYAAHRQFRKGVLSEGWVCLVFALGGILGWAGKVPYVYR